MSRADGGIAVALSTLLALVGTAIALVVPPSSSVMLDFFVDQWRSAWSDTPFSERLIVCESWADNPTVVASAMVSESTIEYEAAFVAFNEFCDEDHDFPG